MKKPAIESLGTDHPTTGCPKSERLVFKQIRTSDIPFIMEYLSDPERTRFLPNEKPYPETLSLLWATNRIKHWDTHHFGTYILIDKFSSKKIGYCGLEYVRDSRFVDIRYGLIQSAWGKGLAIEAAKECLAHGFNHLGFDTLFGAAVAENLASMAVLKRLGMKPNPEFDTYGDVVESFSIDKDSFSKDLS